MEAVNPEVEDGYGLGSFLKCELCGLRMIGRKRSGVRYYICETRRRPEPLVPEGHPGMVYLREIPASEKVSEFLRERVFGADRVPLLQQTLASNDPARDELHEEVERLQKEIAGLNLKVRRQVANLETEEPGTEVAKEIRRRLDELLSVRSKREGQHEAARKALAERPSLEAAAGAVDMLPLIEVDWKHLHDDQFRDLLHTLKFEARYRPSTKELMVKVILLPELLVLLDGGPDSFVTDVSAPHGNRTKVASEPFVTFVSAPNGILFKLQESLRDPVQGQHRVKAELFQSF